MKKLILLLLFIPLVSCNDSKKVKNPAKISPTAEATKKYKKISEKKYSHELLLWGDSAWDYIDNARNGDCISNLSTERIIFMGGLIGKGQWNYIDKTYNVDEAVFGYENPRFVIKKNSIRLDNIMFLYLYSDILCAIKDKNYNYASSLISTALNIYNTNISGYYSINDTKFIRDYVEGITNLKDFIPEKFHNFQIK